jgi:hypothetical protein
MCSSGSSIEQPDGRRHVSWPLMGPAKHRTVTVARPAARPTNLELNKERLNPCRSDMSTVVDALGSARRGWLSNSPSQTDMGRAEEFFGVRTPLFFIPQKTPKKSPQAGQRTGHRAANTLAECYTRRSAQADELAKCRPLGVGQSSCRIAVRSRSFCSSC